MQQYTQHETIAVIGAGLMGAGIAQVFVVKGFRTKVYNPMVESLETLHERISNNLLPTDYKLLRKLFL